MYTFIYIYIHTVYVYIYIHIHMFSIIHIRYIVCNTRYVTILQSMIGGIPLILGLGTRMSDQCFLKVVF